MIIWRRKSSNGQENIVIVSDQSKERKTRDTVSLMGTLLTTKKFLIIGETIKNGWYDGCKDIVKTWRSTIRKV